jgi:hypothetical protein
MEIYVIRKKWSEMKQEKLEENPRLEYKPYEQDKLFEELMDDGENLILAMALGDFNLRLEKGDLREVVRREIWKAAKEKYETRIKVL